MLDHLPSRALFLFLSPLGYARVDVPWIEQIHQVSLSVLEGRHCYLKTTRGGHEALLLWCFLWYKQPWFDPKYIKVKQKPTSNNTNTTKPKGNQGSSLEIFKSREEVKKGE